MLLINAFSYCDYLVNIYIFCLVKQLAMAKTILDCKNHISIIIWYFAMQSFSIKLNKCDLSCADNEG